MKKRFFTLFLAIFMLISAVSLTGCLSLLVKYNESSEAVSETVVSEVSEAETIDAKEVFNSTLEALIPQSDDNEDGLISDLLSSLSELDTDAVLSIDASLSKLNINGADLTKSSPFTLKYKGVSDIENDATTISYDIGLLGERLTLETLTYGSKMYITDFFGINSRPINANESYLFAPVDDSTVDIVYLLKFLNEAIPKVLSANIDDTMYSAETKDMSFNGKEYTDATVVTLSFSDGIIRRIAHEFLDELEKDESISKAFGINGDTEDIMAEVEKLQAIRLINTVADGKSVALTLEVSTIAEDVNGNELVNTAMIILSYNENGFCIQLGTLGANRQISQKHEIKTLTYSAKDGNENIVFEIYDLYSTYKAFELNGTVDGGVRKGKITYKNKAYITCDYQIDIKETGGKIVLSDFVNKKDGQPSDEKYSLTIEFTKDGRGLFADIALDINTQSEDQAITAVGNIDLSFEPQDVTLNDITEKCEEFDYEYYEKTLPLKFPNITAFFDSLYDIDSYLPDELEISIDLPMTFKMYPSEGDYNYVNFYSNEAWIYVIRYDESEFTDFEAYKLKHFAENMRLGTLDLKPSVLTETDGIYYYSFIYSEGYTYTYDAYFYKGDDEFWMVQFSCGSENYSKYKDRFLKWAKSVDPTGRTKYDNSLDDIIDGAIR